MPEPNEAIQATQDTNASTPPSPADQPTTQKTNEKSVLDYLDIPPELQERLAPKAVEESNPAEEPEPEVQQPEKDEEPKELEPDEDDADDAEEEAPAAEQQPQKVDKRLKRINRLTRQKSELTTQLDNIAAENYRLRQQLENGQKQQQTQDQPLGLTGGKLPEIQSEIDKIDAQLAWCDNNADGGEIGEGDKAQYYDGATVKAWRRSAEMARQEKVVEKREEIWNLEQARKQSDSNAYQLWPDMFDKRNPDFQEAVAIIRRYPFLQALPEANLIVGTYLEGLKKLREKVKANGSSNGQVQKQHRDLDERVFGTPRVPIAPHTSEPPTRESKPSSKNMLNEAMSRLAKDSDGSSESVANVFAAMEKARGARPSSRSPVRS